MWVMTTFGFFSIVEKPSDRRNGMLTVRARVKKDIHAFADRCNETTPITYDALGGDYAFRFRAPKLSVAQAMLETTGDIDYDNFKDAVKKRQGAKRAHVYLGVWQHLLQLEPKRRRGPSLGLYQPPTPRRR